MMECSHVWRDVTRDVDLPERDGTLATLERES